MQYLSRRCDRLLEVTAEAVRSLDDRLVARDVGHRAQYVVHLGPRDAGDAVHPGRPSTGLWDGLGPEFGGVNSTENN